MSSNAGPFGAFGYDCGADTWWWSDAVYEIFGFTPGEVVPTLDLILSHKHPDDVSAAHAAFDRAIRTGEDFALWHRLLDAQERVRQVVVVARPTRGPAGEVTGLDGHIIDVTEALRQSSAREVDDAVRASAETRSLIEQVKGALMVSYAVDSDEAFDLLRRYSQLTNVKVREVARMLTSMVAELGQIPQAAGRVFDELRAESVATGGLSPAGGLARDEDSAAPTA